MSKYEDILIEEEHILSVKKIDLLKKIDHYSFKLLRLAKINKKINNKKIFYIINFFIKKEIKQFIRIKNILQSRFNILLEEYWLVNNRLIDIRETLIKHSNKEIEECIKNLGIDEVREINDLLTIYNGKLFDIFSEFQE